ncbi:MAG: hypothetical protein KJO07_02460, partial [Deltaproteobacteria bacterium]|nr:hypothetical protein [Deltaproteobacteria bacterium]
VHRALARGTGRCRVCGLETRPAVAALPGAACYARGVRPAVIILAGLLAAGPASGDAPDDKTAAQLERQAERMIAVVRRRVARTSPKMKLSPAQGRALERWIRAGLGPGLEGRVARGTIELARVMPRSAVELLRAHHERGVSAPESLRIGRYLRRLVATVGFDGLERLDANHSHVIGRDWQQIDYSGERLDWRSQRRYWTRRGVPDFKKASHIHAYLTAASRFRYFRRLYRPRRSMASMAAP